MQRKYGYLEKKHQAASKKKSNELKLFRINSQRLDLAFVIDITMSMGARPPFLPSLHVPNPSLHGRPHLNTSYKHLRIAHE